MTTEEVQESTSNLEPTTVPKLKKRARPAKARRIQHDDEDNNEKQESERSSPAIPTTTNTNTEAEGEGEGEGGEASAGSQSEQASGSTTTISDLLALRKLRAAQRREGIDVHKLNSIAASDAKKRKKKTTALTEGKGDRLRDAEDEDDKDGQSKTQKIVKSNHFTQESNYVDVDKHMMAYIESELKKRKGESNINVEEEMKRLDPEDELFRLVSDKYHMGKTQNNATEDEGNVTLSTAMLTGIPEVDLGIENRMKNITATENAKKELMEKKQRERERRRQEGVDHNNSQFFFRSHNYGEDEKAAMKEISHAYDAGDGESKQKQQQQQKDQQQHHQHHQHHQHQQRPYKRHGATDESTVANFKKRMNRH